LVLQAVSDELVSQLTELVGELVRELLRFSRCELVAVAGDSSETQRKENVRRWKPLPSNGSDDVTVDTGMPVCVTMNCEV
jgi:hypothetical protein